LIGFRCIDDQRRSLYYIRRAMAAPGWSRRFDQPRRQTALKSDTKSKPAWTSPNSGAVYPAEWNLAIPGEGIDLYITPLLNDQELRVSFTYWEGAVRVEGTQTGYGYVELTGYYESLRGRM
jgi:predicted secreted hydrolase